MLCYAYKEEPQTSIGNSLGPLMIPVYDSLHGSCFWGCRGFLYRILTVNMVSKNKTTVETTGSSSKL